MSTTQQKKAFDDAFARFKVAEKELAGLQGRTNDATQRLLDAKLSLARIDQDALNFANGPDASSAKAASDLVTRQSTAGGVVSLLELSVEQLQAELAKAKASVLQCEAACTDAQASYHQAAFTEALNEFLTSNRANIQRLTQGMFQDARFYSVARTGSVSFAAAHVEELFDGPMLAAVKQQWGDDEPFREGCQVRPTKTGSIADLVQSSLITSADRANARAAQFRGPAAVLEALAYREPEVPVDSFNLEQANAGIRQYDELARVSRYNAEQTRAGLARLHEYAVPPVGEAERLKKSVEEHEQLAVRYQSTADGWRARISERMRLVA